MGSLLLLAVFVLVLSGCHGARILAMLPFFGKSHQIFSSAILKLLLQRGHQIVEYGPTPSSEPSSNYTHFEIHSSTENLASKLNFLSYESRKQITQGYGCLIVVPRRFVNI